MINNTFIVLDGNSLFYRAYYAYPPTLSTADGKPVNAVYGFMTMLFNTLTTYKPKYFAIAFDYDRVTFRKNKIGYYKSQRKEADQPLISQYDTLYHILEAFNFPIFRTKGYEADDYLGTFARYFKEKKYMTQDETYPYKMLLVTGDKDIMQAIDKNIEMIYITGTFKNQKILTYDTFFHTYNFKPEFFADYLAIAGDTSDNVIGIKGIGKIGAMKLVEKFNNLDYMYQNIDKVREFSPKYANLLVDNYQNAIDSKFLTTLKTDIELNMNLDVYLVDDFDVNLANKRLNDLGFTSLTKSFEKFTQLYNLQSQLSETQPIESLDQVKVTKPGEILDNNTNDDYIYIYYYIDESISQSSTLFNQSNHNSPIFYIFSHGEICECSLGKLCQAKNKKFIIYDYKKISLLLGYDFTKNNQVFDIKLWSYLQNASRKDYSLKILAREISNVDFWEEKDWQMRNNLPTHKFTNWNNEYKMSFLNHFFYVLNLLFTRLFDNSDKFGVDKYIEKTWKEFSNKALLESGWDKELLLNLEVPLAYILKTMENRGILINISGLKKLDTLLNKQLSNIQKEIYETVGHEFNISSPKQVSNLLFKELLIPSKKKSTNIDILSEISSFHPVIPLIMKYRELSKLYTTYIKGFSKYIKFEKGENVIHTEFLQTAVVTGRLSSINPNMQNLPIKSDMGKEFRSLFIPRKGYKLYSFDYSQIDLRVLAYLSNDENLIDDFRKNKDIHTATAARLLNKKIEDITSNERRMGKTINFGVIYGLSAYGLAKSLNIDISQASEYIEEYFDHYNGVKMYLEDTIANAKENGYVYTILGRRRNIPFINSGNKRIESAAIREAINMPAQGTSADIMKLAMIKVYEIIQKKYKEKAYILLQIHDELVIEIAEDIVNDAIYDIIEAMQNVVKLNVDLKVDFNEW